jgi:pyridoxal phosphate enzyme (YggS family)
MAETASRARDCAVAAGLAEIRSRIEAAARRAGREASEVTLVGVSKTVEPERIRAALDAGLTHLGENRVQEAVEKMKALSDRAPTWHLIGHLQRNKARRAVELFDRIETVDSLPLAEALERGAEEIGRDLRVFVEVNVADEPQKAGVSPGETEALVDGIDALPWLTVTGLMAIPPQQEDPEESRPHFAAMRRLFDEIRSGRPELHHLSMGMSADFEIAVEEGATEVRVGRALFGGRS